MTSVTGARVPLLLTGATGFVGRELVALLARRGFSFKVAVRHGTPVSASWRTEPVFIDDLGPANDWSAALQGVDVVVHAAARVHVMQETTDRPLEAFRHTNVEGTLNFARQAAASGVRRFVFISSVKVNGEQTQLGCPFTAEDEPSPQDPYGTSKAEAEAGLHALAAVSGMELVVVRPPLVYGPGVRANFAAMMRWLDKGVPLPLGAIRNRRSLVGVDNLADFILLCTTHPAAANEVFLVSDGHDVSTTELLRRMATALGRPARLIPLPESWLRWGSTLVGRSAVAQRLCGSLQVDIEKNRRLLGWTPPVSLDQGLRAAAEGRGM